MLQLAESADHTDDDTRESTPWHFKLMVVAVITYLGWRLVDLFV
ncbi:MAG: hypothetical protein P8O03_08700 [Ilumatobacter sp.]|nr:hypothetical protein [Ilumatobacter sp.]MDG2039886.1 hypothetical protein [Ilumatobacter sp.]